MPFIHAPDVPSPPLPELIQYSPLDLTISFREYDTTASYPYPWPSAAYDEHHHLHHPHYNTQRTSTPVVQQVFIIRCKHCDMLFSNRGMKAVLLLRPGLALYSTDAIPRNCSPLTAVSPDEPRATVPVGLPLRTCACLTQTLHCHGCGDSVGYFIVAPCGQCTGASNGTANGHRFVFHSEDVVASVRRLAPKCPPLWAAMSPGPTSREPGGVFWHQLSSGGEVSPIVDNFGL